MPALKPAEKVRQITSTYRLSAIELRYVQKVAAERGTTVSDLVREGLRMQGALPS